MCANIRASSHQPAPHPASGVKGALSVGRSLGGEGREEERGGGAEGGGGWGLGLENGQNQPPYLGLENGGLVLAIFGGECCCIIDVAAHVGSRVLRSVSVCPGQAGSSIFIDFVLEPCSEGLGVLLCPVESLGHGVQGLGFRFIFGGRFWALGLRGLRMRCVGEPYLRCHPARKLVSLGRLSSAQVSSPCLWRSGWCIKQIPLFAVQSAPNRVGRLCVWGLLDFGCEGSVLGALAVD